MWSECLPKKEIPGKSRSFFKTKTMKGAKLGKGIVQP